MITRTGIWGALGALVMLAGACSSSNPNEEGEGAAEAKATKAMKIGLSVSEPVVLQADQARNPTTAVDPKSGTVYAAWAREVLVPASGDEDPVLQAVVARSDDGKTFSEPVVVSGPGDDVYSFAAAPTQVAVGPHGEVYVLFNHHVQHDYGLEGYDYDERAFLRLARSDDGGRTFSAPVEVSGEAVEGVVTSTEMHYLFAADDGDVFISFLDYRNQLDPRLQPATKKYEEGKDAPPTELRMTRSGDGGRTFERSVLVASNTCGCCGTKLAQRGDGPLYATTRSEWYTLKGSYDAVRDHFVSASRDDGATWGNPVKFHDDGFKISGCPDITPGMVVDTKGRLHVAWYTGAESAAGVYYAVSKDQGKTFSPPVTLLHDDWVPYGDVKLALDDRDRAWVAFEDRRDEKVDKVQLVRVDRDGTLSYSQAWPGTAPDVAIHDGKAVVVWGTSGGDHNAGGPVQVATVSQAEKGEAEEAR